MATTPALLDQYEVAWAAGIIDGEGGTYVQRDRRKSATYVNLKMQVGQTGGEEPPAMLTRLQSLFGGRINGPYRRPLTTQKSVWFWRLWGAEPVQGALSAMWAHLGPEKRQQAEEALAEWKESH